MGAIRAIMDELATHKEESEQPTANNNKFGSDFEYRGEFLCFSCFSTTYLLN